jgi:hypothetical protein
MTVPIGIVTHPARGAMARRLARNVDAESLSWDTGNLGGQGNHPQLWSYLQHASAPWVCVLEDDAIPCEDFRHQLDTMLTYAATPIVSLYLPPIVSLYLPIGAAISSNTLANTVGYAIRTELLGSLLASTRQSLRQTTRLGLPERISKWAQRRGHLVSYTRPSLVEPADVVRHAAAG